MDPRDVQLTGSGPKVSRERREHEAALADHYLAAFTAYPDVLADLQREGFITQTTDHRIEQRVDLNAMLIHEGRRQIVMYIMRQMQRASRIKSHGKPPQSAAPEEATDGH